jgi:hypothetical protein
VCPGNCGAVTIWSPPQGGVTGVLRILDESRSWVVEVDGDPGAGEVIAFQPPAERVRVELRDTGGAVFRVGDLDGAGLLTVSTAGLEEAQYELVVQRVEPADGPLDLAPAPPI